jgi:transposase
MPSENVLHVAIELSFSSWLVAARLPGAEKSRLHRVEGGNTAALLALIAELRSRASAKLGRAVNVACCFEAGRDGVWLYRLLTAHGIAAYVLERTSILVNRRARRAKTDRLDVEGMLRVLAAWLGGDRHVCSIVRVPTPDEEDAKRQHREREHLVQEASSASRTGSKRCFSRRASGAGHRCARGGATWSSYTPATDARCRPCCGASWTAYDAGSFWSWS